MPEYSRVAALILSAAAAAIIIGVVFAYIPYSL